MKKLIKGLRTFRSNYVRTHLDLFEQLAQGQKPRVLLITCSDSRVDPNLIFQAELGDLFVIRNAGNIVPPYGATNGGEGATIEYAMQALDIKQIIICGHSHCGAMKGLIKLNSIRSELPLVHDWLKYSEATRRLVLDNYGDYESEELLEIMIAENVLTQIENLRTYPVIHSKLYRGDLKIYAWIYHLENGEILAYDPDKHAYVLPDSLLPPSERDGEPVNAFPACEFLSTDGAPDLAIQQPNGNKGSASYSRRFPLTPLSPEQANRIYRGTATK